MGIVIIMYLFKREREGEKKELSIYVVKVVALLDDSSHRLLFASYQ